MSENATLEKTEQSIEKTAIRDFAVSARRKLKEKIELQANIMGFFADGREVSYEFEDEHQFKINGETFDKKQADILKKQIKEKGFDSVIDEVAYTWFNRFIALYFMEIHNYIDNGLNIISSVEDINGVALKAPNCFSKMNKENLFKLIQDNRTEDVYKALIIAQCNELNSKLPFMFEEIQDYTELLFPQGLLNNDSVIKEMLALDRQNWQEVEVIGWLYQYYISEKKEQLDYELKNVKNRKVQKEDMPAKTQLFTPKWIVSYMVENSVCKMWLEAHPDERLQSQFKYYLESAEQEPEVQEELNKIIDKTLMPENIKVLDPACGSGHILVTAFELLYKIYKSAGYVENEIAELIIKKNLFGLDICNRAAQLSQLAIIMKAREFDKDIFNKIEELNIASIQDTNWIDSRVQEALMNDNDNKLLAQQQIENLATTFKDAKEFGSIINVKDLDFEFWNKKLVDIQSLNMGLFYNDVTENLRRKLPQIIKQAKIMQQKYETIITNPPYLGATYYDGKLGEFIKMNYPNSKSDICVAFIEKILNMTKKNCYCSLVTMQSWMFLSSFEKFREDLLNNSTIQSMTHMGNNVMRIAFGTCATVWKKTILSRYKAIYSWIENSNINDEDIPYIFPIKDNGCYNVVAQNGFHSIPGSPIAYWASDRVREIFANETPLGELAIFRTGMKTGDNERFLKYWFEIKTKEIEFNSLDNNYAVYSQKKWFPYNKGGEFRKWYGNYDYIINFYDNGREIFSNVKAENRHVQNLEETLRYKECLTWTLLSSYATGFRYRKNGSLYDMNGMCLFPYKTLKYILALCNTKIAYKFFQIISSTIAFQAGDIAKLPVISTEDTNLNCKINNLVEQNIAISKEDWDSFETSWDFEQHPLLRFRHCERSEAIQPIDCHVADAPRNDVSFRIQDCFINWKEHTEQQFNKLKANEEELNRLFIEIYGLQDEMTPEVADKDITIRKADELREIKSLLSYAVGCMFGRYSLDEKGLVFAGGEFDFSKYKSLEADDDGIKPILSDSWFDDDVIDELKKFLKAAFGEVYLTENLTYIADVLGRKNGESADERIRNYYLKEFYKDHLQIYKKRPIYWMFSSGKEKAFNCLIYMHRYDRSTLAAIRKVYLHEYQAKLDRAKSQADNDGDIKKSSLYAKYQTELIEFDRKLKDFADEQIELDLDDGVKVNYGKFKGLLEAEKDIAGKEK